MAIASQPKKTAAPIRFDATPYVLEGATILRLPERASEQLPSRGQVAVQAEINGHAFQTVMEPDGAAGHWIKVDDKLRKAAGVQVGDTVAVAIEPVAQWPEPRVPVDFKAALDAAPPKIQDLWREITPMARWEWVRWVNATANPATRQKRVEVSISKMKSGTRRPCCFNRSACTDPEVSKNGRLLGIS